MIITYICGSYGLYSMLEKKTDCINFAGNSATFIDIETGDTIRIDREDIISIENA